MGWKPVLHWVPGSPDLRLCIMQLAPLYKAALLRSCTVELRPGCEMGVLPLQSRGQSAESLIARVHCLYLILSRVPC